MLVDVQCGSRVRVQRELALQCVRAEALPCARWAASPAQHSWSAAAAKDQAAVSAASAHTQSLMQPPQGVLSPQVGSPGAAGRQAAPWAVAAASRAGQPSRAPASGREEPALLDEQASRARPACCFARSAPGRGGQTRPHTSRQNHEAFGLWLVQRSDLKNGQAAEQAALRGQGGQGGAASPGRTARQAGIRCGPARQPARSSRRHPQGSPGGGHEAAQPLCCRVSPALIEIPALRRLQTQRGSVRSSVRAR